MHHQITTRPRKRASFSSTPVVAADTMRPSAPWPRSLATWAPHPRAAHTEGRLEDTIVAQITAMLTELGLGFSPSIIKPPQRQRHHDFVDLLFEHLYLHPNAAIECALCTTAAITYPGVTRPLTRRAPVPNVHRPIAHNPRPCKGC